MSYESEMLKKLKMPPREEVEKALLKCLFYHNGVIKEFGTGEEIVEEIANDFNINEKQRNTYLETIYRKENRLKKSNLWHRLLFRAADSLAKQKLVSRPTHTIHLTNRREWMLTEEGYDKILDVLRIPKSQKNYLNIKSYEVEKIVNKLKEQPKPENYSPINIRKKKSKVSILSNIRNRGFRQVVIQSYDYQCAICGLKIYSPTSLHWEVEAAHIVPQSNNGKDDIWNGLSLCRFHHWAFDVGWFSLDNNLKVIASKHIKDLPIQMGKIWEFDFIRKLSSDNLMAIIPANPNLRPDLYAIKWHRENIFQ